MTLTPAARSGLRATERWVCTSCRLRGFKQSKNSFSTAIRHPNQKRLLLPQHNSQSIYLGQSNHRWNSTTILPTKPARTREPKLPSTPARTRFAPSPTGYLHIGGLRTALFSYLLAKRTGGQFLLRIEDTDQKRLVPDAESKLLSDLEWAGLQWDEGPGIGGPYGPYRQSERTEIYREHAEQLLGEGSAYRCFCAPQSAAGAYVTSSCYQNCSDLSHDESRRRAEGGREAFTVRLRVPADAHKRVYPDLVYGKIQRLKRSPAASQSEDGDAGMGSADTILLKSDGTPTYHFANVVDDHLMRITHVIRGVEWAASTPLHYDIYSAFGWTPPQFAHVGLLVDQNQAKLSKRNQDMALDVASMRDTYGVLPETLVNFLALLGWSNPTNNDVMGMQALIENFDLKFTKGNAMVRMEKLWFLQRKHVADQCSLAIKHSSFSPISPILAQIQAQLKKTYPNFSPEPCEPDGSTGGMEAYCAAILFTDPSNFQNPAQWVDRNRYYFHFDPVLIPPEKEFYDTNNSVRPEELKRYARKLINVLDTDVGPGWMEYMYWQAEIEEDLAIVSDFTHWEQSMREGLDQAIDSVLEEDMERIAAEKLDKAIDASEEDEIERTMYDGIGEQRERLLRPFMKFLREKIVMGLPGPNICLAMAVLGPDECAERLRLALGVKQVAWGQDYE